MAKPWDAEKFFGAYVVPQRIGAFDLLRVEREDAKFDFAFKPTGAPDEATTHVYAKWDSDTGMISLWQIISTEIPRSKTGDVLKLLNKLPNVPAFGMLTKTCILPAGVQPEWKNLKFLCGWSLGLYEESLVEEEGQEVLRALVLSSMLRIIMEVISITLELGEIYPKYRAKA